MTYKNYHLSMRLILLTLLFFTETTYSQNLIPDPGFEEVLMVKNKSTYDYKYLTWNNVVPRIRTSGIGIPKYSLYLEYSASSKIDSHEKYLTKEIINSWYKPHSGDSYLNEQYVFFRNLVQARLLSHLRKDSIYYFQAYIKVSANNYGAKDFAKGMVGVWFSNRDFSDSLGSAIMQNNKLKIRPQIHISDFKISNNEKWVRYSASFKSDNDYTYVMVGNFENLMEQNDEIWTKKRGINYNLDDLCLVPYWQKGSCSLYDMEEVFELKNVYFDLNSAELNSTSKKDLLEMSDRFKSNNTKLKLIGYADSTGKEDKNKELSKSRAQTVYDFFKNSGVEESRMSFEGKGSVNPLETNITEDGRKMNRRVEIKIIQE